MRLRGGEARRVRSWRVRPWRVRVRGVRGRVEGGEGCGYADG